MTRREAWDRFLRQEKPAVEARLASEGVCIACIRAPMAYCVQCEVKDINLKRGNPCAQISRQSGS